MRALNIAIGVVVFTAGVVRAQEAPAPSPSPSKAPVPKAAVPKLLLPVLPITPITVSPGTGPIVPTTAVAAPKRPRDVLPVTTSASPALPALPVRLPEASRPAGADPGRPRLFLEAISTINGEPVAMINNRKLAAGDMIAGARVMRILEYRVELEYQGRRFAIGF